MSVLQTDILFFVNHGQISLLHTLFLLGVRLLVFVCFCLVFIMLRIDCSKKYSCGACIKLKLCTQVDNNQ